MSFLNNLAAQTDQERELDKKLLGPSPSEESKSLL